jgi:hypothetical protein
MGPTGIAGNSTMKKPKRNTLFSTCAVRRLPGPLSTFRYAEVVPLCSCCRISAILALLEEGSVNGTAMCHVQVACRMLPKRVESIQVSDAICGAIRLKWCGYKSGDFARMTDGENR